MTFYCPQALYDRAIADGLDMSEWEPIKQIPTVPKYQFTVRADIDVKRQRGKTAQWKVERRGYR